MSYYIKICMLVIFFMTFTGCKSWVTVESKHMDAEIARMNALSELYKAKMAYDKDNKLLSLKLDGDGKVQAIEVGQQSNFNIDTVSNSMRVSAPSQHPVANSVNHVTDKIVNPLETIFTYAGIGYVAKQVKGSNTTIDGEGNTVNIDSGNTATLTADTDITKYSESEIDQSDSSNNSDNSDHSIDNTDNHVEDNRYDYENSTEDPTIVTTEPEVVVVEPEVVVVDPTIVEPNVINTNE